MSFIKRFLPAFLLGALIGGTTVFFSSQFKSTAPLFTTQSVLGDWKDIGLVFADGSTKTLGEVHQNQYLLLNLCSSTVGFCAKGAKQYNDLFKKWSEQGYCQLLTITEDRRDLTAWIGKISDAPFVQKWSAYVVDGLYKLMNALQIPGTVLPHYVLMDSSGKKVIEQSGWGDLEKNFAPYCGSVGFFCDIDQDGYISKQGISSDPKDVPHVKKEQVGSETKYIYCDAQSCKYVTCDETTAGKDCNDSDQGITIPGTACASPEGYPGILDDTCTCQTNLWFCDGDLDGHKSKTPYSTDPIVVPHIKEVQVGAESKFILCDANECHYVDCAHMPGDDCNDIDKTTIECGGNGGGSPTNNCGPAKGRCGGPNGDAINYPGQFNSAGSSCVANDCSYCTDTVCHPTGGVCYYFCQDSKGQENNQVLCANGNATQIAQPTDCPIKLNDMLAGCGTYCSEKGGTTSTGSNGGGSQGTCGPAHGQAFKTADEVNAAGLCTAGTSVPAVVTGPAPWHRSCRGDLSSSLCASTQKGTIGGAVDSQLKDGGSNSQ